jgi:hypothetical protein
MVIPLRQDRRRQHGRGGRLAIDNQKESGTPNSFAGKHCGVRRG